MKSLTVYRINGKPSVTEGDLRKYAFQPIDNEPSAMSSSGFVSFDDYMDSEFKAPIHVAHFTRFALRMDTRRVSPAIMRKHMKVAMKAEMAATGKAVIRRERKKEITEQVRLRLMARTEPKPEHWPVVIDNTSGMVFFGCVRKAAKEMFATLAPNLMPGVVIAELTPMELDPEGPEDASGFLAAILAKSMDVSVDGRPYSVTIQDKALAFDHDMRISAATLNGGEVEEAFQGRTVAVQKGRVVIEGDASSTTMDVNSEFAITGIKLPKIDASDDDPDGEFLERMFLIGVAVGALHAAFKTWCQQYAA